MALGKGLSSLIPQQKKKVNPKKSAIEHDRIWNIPLSEIVPNTEQPRKDFSHKSLEELVTSIKMHGILQPITVTEKDDGGYELIAGERRLRAAEVVGLATIPAIVRTATRQQKLELALIENLQREDLNPIEEAFAYKRLMEEFSLKQQEVADQVGKSRPQIANTARLLDLPNEVQKALIDGKLNVGKARALLSLKSEKDLMRVFAGMIGERATVRDIERVVASHGDKSRKGSIRRDPNIHAQESLIEDRLGTKVRVTKKGEKGTIIIYYNSKEELKRLVEELS